jgi:hypothetical protein
MAKKKNPKQIRKKKDKRKEEEESLQNANDKSLGKSQRP